MQPQEARQVRSRRIGCVELHHRRREQKDPHRVLHERDPQPRPLRRAAGLAQRRGDDQSVARRGWDRHHDRDRLGDPPGMLTAPAPDASRPGHAAAGGTEDWKGQLDEGRPAAGRLGRIQVKLQHAVRRQLGGARLGQSRDRPAEAGQTGWRSAFAKRRSTRRRRRSRRGRPTAPRRARRRARARTGARRTPSAPSDRRACGTPRRSARRHRRWPAPRGRGGGPAPVVGRRAGSPRRSPRARRPGWRRDRRGGRCPARARAGC